MSETRKDEQPLASLTAEEWAGLARLGRLIHESEDFWTHGSAGASVAGLLRRAGDWHERYELDETLAETLETLRTLREAGVLRMVRENATLVVESLTLLRPLLPKILAALEGFSLPRLLETLSLVADLGPRLRALAEAFSGELGQRVVAELHRLGNLWEETRVEETLTAVLRLAATLEETGILEKLRDLALWIRELDETIDVESLIGRLIQSHRDDPLLALPVKLARVGSVVAESLADAPREPTAGGFKGIVRLLKDPEVQRGLRFLAFVAARMASDTRTESGSTAP